MKDLRDDLLMLITCLHPHLQSHLGLTILGHLPSQPSSIRFVELKEGKKGSSWKINGFIGWDKESRIVFLPMSGMYFEAFLRTMPLAFSANVTITSRAKCFRLVISLLTRTLMQSSKTWSRTLFKNLGATSAISMRHFWSSSLSELSLMLSWIFYIQKRGKLMRIVFKNSFFNEC